jgi:hypothetical protein
MNFKSIPFWLIAASALNACGDSKDSSVTKSNPTQETTSNDSEPEVAATADFGTLLIELESNIGWSAVTEHWKDRREGWISDCNSKTSIPDKANLLIEFEGNLKWEAVDPRWADRRETWINDLKNSSNNGDLGSYLAELEEYIIWDVVSPNWANIREIWVKNCSELSEGQW